MTAELAVNGRFEHLEPGGFRQYAVEVARRLPAETIVPPASFGRGFRGRLWENVWLPRLVGARVLVNLTGSAPRLAGPQVTVIHDLLPLQLPDHYSPSYVRWFGKGIETVVRHSNALVVPSSEVRQTILDRFPVDPATIFVAAPGISRPSSPTPQSPSLDAALRRVGIEDGQPLVVGINSSVPRKNGISVLSALDQVQRARPEVAVVAIGHDGPARVMGSSTRPHHAAVPDLGCISDGDVEALFSRADVVVSLSLGEGFGLVPLEAAVRGARVVSSPVPSLVHLTEGCRTAVSGDDAAVAIIDLLADPPPVSYEHLLDELTWDRTADVVLAAATSALDGPTMVELEPSISASTTTAPQEGSTTTWHA